MNVVPFFLASDNSITVFLAGESYPVSPDHPNYKKVLEGLTKGASEKELKVLVDIVTSFNQFGRGKIKVDRDSHKITYCDRPVNNLITDKIFQLLALNLPSTSLINFLENIMQNPSASAREATYKFLEHKNMPLTEDGCFLAYKNVRANLRDWYSDKVDNSVGRVISIERGEVDDNREKQCSFGFHVGSPQYLKNFHSGESIGLIVKINPADVVSVPTDATAQKLRVCKYTVVGLRDGQQVLDKPVYANDASDYDEEDDYYDDEPEMGWDSDNDWGI